MKNRKKDAFINLQLKSLIHFPITDTVGKQKQKQVSQKIKSVWFV